MTDGAWWEEHPDTHTMSSQIITIAWLYRILLAFVRGIVQSMRLTRAQNAWLLDWPHLVSIQNWLHHWALPHNPPWPLKPLRPCVFVLRFAEPQSTYKNRLQFLLERARIGNLFCYLPIAAICLFVVHRIIPVFCISTWESRHDGFNPTHIMALSAHDASGCFMQVNYF